LKFDEKGIEEVRRKFFGTLYNTYGFFSLYANVDGWDGSDAPASHTDIDRWLLSRMNSLLRDVKAAYEAFEPMTAGRLVQSFVTDQLSNWYVRLNRKRFWRGELTDDKKAAYYVLKQALGLTAQLMAPIAPFYADRLYTDLSFGESVHLSLLPEVDASLIDEALEQRMDYAQRISSLGFSLRKTGDRRVRQPLAKLLLPILDADFEKQVKQVEELILQELNVKETEYVSGDALSKTIKPNFRVLGKKVGKQMKAAAAIINQLDADAITALESTGEHTIDLEGTPFTLTREDVDIAAKDIPGWSIASDGALTVALDLTLTPELEIEGLARELVNRIQNLRKEAGLEVTDRITVELSDNEQLAKALVAHEAYISSEVLADAISIKAGVTGTATDLGANVGEVILKVEKV